MWLKRRTPQKHCDRAPPARSRGDRLAAVTGSVDLLPLILFAIVFFWTPPHFWSLALWANDDYRRANVPMLPVSPARRKPAGRSCSIRWAGAPVAGALGDRLRRPRLRLAAAILGAGFLWRMARRPRSQTRPRQPDQRRTGPARSNTRSSTCSCVSALAVTGWRDEPDGSRCKPPARNAATDPDGHRDLPRPRSLDPNSFDRQPRQTPARRNWPCCSAARLSARSTQITLVKWPRRMSQRQ